jgi:hypothetical protein
MMRHPENAQTYLEQYRRLPTLLALPYGADLGEEVLAFLCNRDALSRVPGLKAELAGLDRATADAVAAAPAEWQTRLTRWAAQGGFDSSPWWLEVQRRAHRQGVSISGLSEAVPAGVASR